MAARDFSAALRIPTLPEDAPAAPTPAGFTMPLLPHQQRALHRCLLIEKDGSLSENFQGLAHYKSRGGVLADAVGLGKTATTLALLMSGDEEPGPTLVVAPSHLIRQWADEARKFVGDTMRIIEGTANLKAAGRSLAGERALVLIDVVEVLAAPRYWYDFRRIFKEQPKKRQTKKGPVCDTPPLACHPQEMEKYRTAAQFCVESPRGPCSYDGWVYTGGVHLPEVPWRRAVFDEVQDLVRVDSDAHKCLMQASRTARNVWLLSATPFPHGNESVFANHELLGFCRLKLNV